MSSNPTRFDGRVQSYQAGRPSYPRQIIPFLAERCGLTSTSCIADVAAGTGLLTQLFLDNGNPTVAVEPNAEMRSACSGLARSHSNLTVMEGTAEHTTLPSASVDFVTVAQAMHWFDWPCARREFVRILRPNGWCVIVYNIRRMDGDAFHEGYETLLRTFGIDYEAVLKSHPNESQLRSFFLPGAMHRHSLRNLQQLDLQGLMGRLLSSSYLPKAGHPRHPHLLQAAESLFAAQQQAGHVQLEYDCVLSYGHLAE